MYQAIYIHVDKLMTHNIHHEPSDTDLNVYGLSSLEILKASCRSVC